MSDHPSLGALSNTTGGGPSSSAGEAWRGLRWSPPLLAVVLTAEVAIGGANDWTTRPAAALANSIVAMAIMLATSTSSRVWTRMRRPLWWFVAALAWACLPRLLPAGTAALMGIPINPAPDRLWPELAEEASRLGLVVAGCAASYRLKAVRPFVIWLSAIGTVYLSWMIVSPLPWRFLLGEGQGRYAATIGNWNAAGTYFGMIATLCFAAILGSTTPRRFAWSWLFVLPLAAGMLLCIATQSRSAFTLATMALAMGLVWHLRSASLLARKRGALLLVVSVGLAVMLLAYFGAHGLFPRYFALSTDGVSRWDIITAYFGISLEAPLWGFGPGSFFEVNQARLTPATALRFWDFGAAHNAALQIALENGWPALLLLVAGVFAIGRDITYRPWTAEDIGLIGALTIAAGASMVDIAWNVPAIGALMCTLLGVLWGARPVRAPGTQLIRRSSTGRARGVPATS